jgi:hypothetical protein
VPDEKKISQPDFCRPELLLHLVIVDVHVTEAGLWS